MQQLEFFENIPSRAFGGQLLKSRRKIKRPLSRRHPIHLVLRADCFVFKGRDRIVLRLWNEFARKFGVKTYQFAVNGNHIHALIRIHSRETFTRFIQAFTGTLALRLKFKWLVRPFTRIVEWGRSFRIVKTYVRLNQLEADREMPPRLPRMSKNSSA